VSAQERRRVHVWHDAEGKILAVGSPATAAGPDVEIVAVPLAQGEVGVLEVEVEHHAVDRLHESHRVDVSAGELRPRSTSG